jgi:hypothetical protein
MTNEPGLGHRWYCADEWPIPDSVVNHVCLLMSGHDGACRCSCGETRRAPTPAPGTGPETSEGVPTDVRLDLAAIKARSETATPLRDEREYFIGWEPRTCGEHRTVGDRAWCYDCREWCYPKIELRCAGCDEDRDQMCTREEFLAAKVERLIAENERLRSAAEQLLVDAKDVPTISMRHVSHVLRAALEPVQRSGGGTEP